MLVGKVSFGKVIAVSGKPKKVAKLNQHLADEFRNGRIMVKDVTQKYEYASPSGMLAQAAQRGEKVSIYITNSDVAKVKNRERSWDTVNGILSNLSTYYDLNRQSVGSIAQTIKES